MFKATNLENELLSKLLLWVPENTLDHLQAKHINLKKGQMIGKFLDISVNVLALAKIPSHDSLESSRQFLSLYNIRSLDDRSELIIYDTENKKEEVKVLNTGLIDEYASITQLPNSEIFCYGSVESGIALIIDRSYRVRILPSGTRCCYSSTLYFNNNIYCFGGYDKGEIALSRKFDLEKNKWANLNRLPKADFSCHSVIFNGNILVSGYLCKNLWIYSIEIESFSIIPYDFVNMKEKFLINVERLYLFEWVDNGLIYESEDEYHWKPVSKSGQLSLSYQMYCLYNKEKLYISAGKYYQFGLKIKTMLEIK